jgi:5-methylcytosine-specific restriction endonuclease McrA
MKPYLKNFLTYHKLDKSDFIACAICKSKATEVHHISGKPMGNKSKRYDVPENLIPLCRDCHIKAHNEVITKGQCKLALYNWSKNNKSEIKIETILKFK